MEDVVLLDIIERYLTGQMEPEEKAWFKQLREKTPEIDQMVVEHKLFLHQLDAFADHNTFKHTIVSAHNNLLQKGDIYEGGKKTTRGRVVQLFHKYKRVTGIAASIAGITALGISILVAYLSPAINKSQIEQLNRTIESVKHTQQLTTDKINHLDGIKPPVQHNYTVGGTAFLIDCKGYLITNAHVLQGTGATVINRGHEFEAKIVAIDRSKDLAILKINDDDYKPLASLPYSIKKTNVQMGEELFTLGYPTDQISYSLGYLSAELGYQGDTTSCQISLNANPGNSGSPVFNKNGDIVGILTAKQSQAEEVVFAVKSKGIYQMIDELRENDTTIQKIKITNNNSLKGEGRTDQISKVRDCVFLVKAYNK